MTENTKKCHVLAPTLEAVGAMVFGVSVITIPVYNENFKKVIEKTLAEETKVIICDITTDDLQVELEHAITPTHIALLLPAR